MIVETDFVVDVPSNVSGGDVVIYTDSRVSNRVSLGKEKSGNFRDADRTFIQQTSSSQANSDIENKDLER